MIKHSLLTLLCSVSLYCSAANINVRLVINNGSHALTGGAFVDAKTYSVSSTFSENSDIFIWNQNDVINLKVVNLDSEPHGLTIENYVNINSIVSGDSISQSFTLTEEGVFRYFDPVDSPYNEYLGLSGIVHVKSTLDNTPYFYWDIREIDSSWNELITSNTPPALVDYDPDYFTVNGVGNPDINLDVLARPTGIVGEEFKIILVNNGQSIHSMHFHGYHLTIATDSKRPLHVGRSKDTFPLYPSEHLILSCTPDKPGEYPIHDHNLVAVTGGQEYATGMFITLLITE